jgi:peptidoglycan/LPS O-acetylase OafA/YrhL
MATFVVKNWLAERIAVFNLPEIALLVNDWEIIFPIDAILVFIILTFMLVLAVLRIPNKFLIAELVVNVCNINLPNPEILIVIVFATNDWEIIFPIDAILVFIILTFMLVLAVLRIPNKFLIAELVVNDCDARRINLSILCTNMFALKV